MGVYERAVGALLGLFVNDAFGVQTECDKQAGVLKEFPQGILEMDSKERSPGKPGMLTYDSELAIILAMNLIHCNDFDVDFIKK